MRGRYNSRRYGRPAAPVVGPLASKSGGGLFYYSWGRAYFMHPTRGWKSAKYSRLLYGSHPEIELARERRQ